MNNLFSIFEPKAFFSLPMNWISSFLILSFLFSYYWIAMNKSSFFLKNILSYLNNELKAVFSSWAPEEMVIIPMTLFFFILLNNFMGLFPYIFTSSSHLPFTMSLALPLWLGHMIMGWVKTSSNMFAHLVPLGTPSALMPFMVIIELTSSIIRPLTLSVRLAANMIAGHLLLTLLALTAVASPYPILFFIIISLVVLSLLEVAVSLIQSYVFMVLSTLYFNEIDNPNLRKYKPLAYELPL